MIDEVELSTFDEDHDAGDSKSPGRSKHYDQPCWFLTIILICISFVAFGSYFAYDAVSALEHHIREDLEISTFQFGLLFSVYSIPNIVLVLVGGVFIDRVGNSTSTLFFCGLFAFGSGLVAVSPLFSSYFLMLFGRFIFGLGSESAYVVQNNLCVEWFAGSKHLGFAMGVTLTVSRLGSILAFNVEALLAEAAGHYLWALFFAFFMTVFSFLTGVIYVLMNRWALRRAAVHPPKSSFANLCRPSPSAMSCSQTLSHPKKSIMHFFQIFSIHYWLWVCVGVLIYTSTYTFLALSSGYIVEKYHVSPSTAGFFLSWVDLVPLFLSPFFGWIVDKTGKRGYVVLAGNVVAIFGYLVMGMTSLHPLVGLLLLGLHFGAMPAAFWPCLPLLVAPQHSALGYAIISALMNLSLAIVQPLAGAIADWGGFRGYCLFFAFLSTSSVAVALLWLRLDSLRSPPRLNNLTPILPSHPDKYSPLEEENP